MLKRTLSVLLVVVAVAAVAIPASAVGFNPNPVGLGSLLDTGPFIVVYADTDYLLCAGDSWTYRGTLRGGESYKFQLVVPWDANFDIKIYDENNNLVGSGTKARGADESVTITPAWTGPFRIVVYSCSGGGQYTLKMLKRL